MRCAHARAIEKHIKNIYKEFDLGLHNFAVIMMAPLIEFQHKGRGKLSVIGSCRRR